IAEVRGAPATPVLRRERSEPRRSLEASAAMERGRDPAKGHQASRLGRGRPRTSATVLASMFAALIALSGCSASNVKAGDLHGHVLDPPFEVAATALEDTDGQPYSLADNTDKRLTLVFFGYTNCPDICGTVMGNLASAMTRLEQRGRDQVDVVFVTTDPARDTGPVLRRYLDHYDKSFIGVTDDPADIDQIASVAGSVAVGM